MSTIHQSPPREPATTRREPSSRRGRGRIERSQARAGLGFLAPFLIVFALVFIAPLLYAVYLSLFKTQLIGGTAFVGLDNYARAFADEKLWSGLGRVLLVLLVQVPIMLAVAVFAALAIDSGRLAGARFYRIGIFLPYAVPGVVAVLMWGFIYSERYGLTGNINELLGAPLLDPLSQAWILPAIGNILTWEFMGYNMLIFYSALRTIPSDLYEAAAIDGAGAVRVAWSIKLPALRSVGYRDDLLDHRQFPAVQRAEHPPNTRSHADLELLHAEHVRLQPELRRSAVQLRGHGRYHHGDHHSRDRLRRATARREGDAAVMTSSAIDQSTRAITTGSASATGPE